MDMTKEEEKKFVPYEESMALMELGFDELCINSYTETEHKYRRNQDEPYQLNSYYEKVTNTQGKNECFGHRDCAAPLKQDAFSWFRDKFSLGIDSTRDGGYWALNIVDYIDEDEESPADSLILVTPEESYEKAELNALKKLIEIVKENR